MNVNELIIGGWYLLDGKPIKVEGYCRGNVFYDGGYECGLYEVEPIKLTEDILKVNGFIKRGESTFYYGELFKFHVAVWIFKNEKPEEDDIVIEVSNDLKKRGVNSAHICENGYVHILQHALRLCGLNELADNFKINR